MVMALDRFRFLVVDDNHHMRSLVRLILGSAGAGLVREAQDGREALADMRFHVPDILITDWMMSPMDGMDLTRYIRTAERSPARSLPIIMMADRAEAGLASVARTAGATDVVPKPLSAAALFRSIRGILTDLRGLGLSTCSAAEPWRVREASETVVG